MTKEIERKLSDLCFIGEEHTWDLACELRSVIQEYIQKLESTLQEVLDGFPSETTLEFIKDDAEELKGRPLGNTNATHESIRRWRKVLDAPLYHDSP